MFSTLNMGIGLLFIVSAADKETVISALSEAGEQANVIGRVVAGESVTLV
jgi:phosphoribosylformylglycinamidine cyclo-ligase